MKLLGILRKLSEEQMCIAHCIQCDLQSMLCHNENDWREVLQREGYCVLATSVQYTEVAMLHCNTLNDAVYFPIASHVSTTVGVMLSPAAAPFTSMCACLNFLQFCTANFLPCISRSCNKPVAYLHYIRPKASIAGGIRFCFLAECWQLSLIKCLHTPDATNLVFLMNEALP